MIRFNAPIDITGPLSPAVKAVLSVGGSFALFQSLPDVFHDFEKRLQSTLDQIGKGTYGPRIMEYVKNSVTRYNAFTPTGTAKEKYKLSRLIRKGLQEIRHNHWILKQADKNLGLVLMSQEAYGIQAYEHLLSPTFREVIKYPLPMMQNIVRKLITASPWTPERKEEMLAKCKALEKPSEFYVLPKIHKPTFCTRPITAQHSYILAPLSRELSKVLNQLVNHIPEVSRNSVEVVRELEKLKLPPDLLLVTYDVQECYPSIDLKDAFSTLSQLDIFKIKDRFWMRVLEAIMSYNFIHFDNCIFQQVKGTATDTAVAPPFANLYLWLKFRATFAEYRNIILYNRRYIDDGLLLLRRNTKGYVRLREKLSQCSSMKLTWTHSENSAIFLDLQLYRGTRHRQLGIIDLEIYTKPISKFLYLHASSSHPTNIFTGIIRGELNRSSEIRQMSRNGW